MTFPHRFLAASALACAAAVSLSGCGTLGGLPNATNTSANLTAIQNSLDKFNGSVAANCSGNLDFTQILPMPPTLGVHIQCAPRAGAVAPTPVTPAPVAAVGR